MVKKNYELQHGSCTDIFSRPAGRTKKIKIRSSELRLLHELSYGQESAMKKESL